MPCGGRQRLLHDGPGLLRLSTLDRPGRFLVAAQRRPALLLVPMGSRTLRHPVERVDQEREDPVARCAGQETHEAARILPKDLRVVNAVVHPGDALPQGRDVLPARVLRGLGGQQSDIQIQAQDLLALRERLDEVLAKHTGQPKDKIHRDTDRDNILTAEEAVEYGLVDQIMIRRNLPAEV